MTMATLVALVVGVLTSLLIEVVPGLRRRWAEQRFKALVLFAAHVGVPMALWAFACYVYMPPEVSMSCTMDGLYRVTFVSVTSFASNQGAYFVGTHRLPNAQARREAP